MPGKKKKGKAFGNFGQSLAKMDEAVSFEKALNTVKNVELDYQAVSAGKHLAKKVSLLARAGTVQILDKTVFQYIELPSNYLAFVESVYAKLKDGKENEPVKLNWTGLEHMTDAVFGCLLEKIKAPGYAHVLGIILTGCCHVTDVGIRWMTQCFPKLKEVCLDGCLGVTETGLFDLVTNCPDIKTLDLTATSVTVLPTQLFDKDVDVAGCPLVSPSEGLLEQPAGIAVMKEPNYKKPANANVLKVCLIRPNGFTSNILPQITGEKVNKSETLLFKPNVTLKNPELLTNIIEFSEGMLDKFVSKRSVIVVPYVHEETKPLDDTVTWLFSIFCQVLTKVSKASVLFVALVKDENAAVNHHMAAFEVKVKQAKEILLKQMQQQMEPKVIEVTEEDPLTKLDQDKFTSTKHMIEMLETQAPKVKFITGIKDRMEKSSNLIREIYMACERTIELYPEYEEISSHMYQYICSDSYLKMFESNDLTNALSLEGASVTSYKTMELLHWMGRLVLMNMVNEPSLVMDIAWLSNLLSNVTMETNSGLFPYISPTTQVLPLFKAEKLLEEKKLGDKNSINVLNKLGFGMSTKNAFVTYNELESDPPIPMEDFIGQSSDVQEICYKFNLVHGLGTSVMNKIFSFTTYIRKPIVMWRDGIVLLDNIIQVVIQRKYSKDCPYLELLVQTSKAEAGSLNELLPKSLIHTAKKMKVIIDYILTSHRLPYQVQMTNNLSKKEEVQIHFQTLHGIVVNHSIHSREDNITLCKNCGVSTRQTNFLLELQKNLIQPNTIFDVDEEKVPGDFQETGKKGDNIINVGSELLNTQKGLSTTSSVQIQAKPACNLMVKTIIDPYEQPEISFTLLDSSQDEDIRIELRSGLISKRPILSYSLKTGELTQGEQSKKMFAKSHLGKNIKFKMEPLCEQGFIHGKLIVNINGEAQTQLKIPARGLIPIIKPDPTMKPSDMKSVLMVHGHRSRKFGQEAGLQPGMRLEARDRKTPTFICVATVEKVYDNGELKIHFDGWTDKYDYRCDPSTDDIHPVGWFEANKKEPFMRKYNPKLQVPKGYDKEFRWPSYCEEVDCIPVPFNFFSEEQKGKCTDDEIELVYTVRYGFNVVSYSDKRGSMHCSESNTPGTYLEYRLLSFRNEMTDEVVGFFSNHRQFLFLLPEKFDVRHLRFPSLTSVMSIGYQKVHFICPGQRMELLHLVDHPGLPLHHFMMEASDTDIHHLYSYLELIYMGLLLQPNVLPWDLNKLCPGVDSSDEEKLELLEMGFKRIFFHYLLWIHAYNVYATPKGKKFDRSTVLPAKILKDEKSVKSLSSAFNITSSSNMIRCLSHSQAVIPNAGLHEIDSSQLQSYAKFMHKFEFQGNDIATLPDNFFTMFDHLSDLNLADNKLTSLPEGFSSLGSLDTLDISNNHLTALPKDFESVKDSLETLNISCNPFSCIPSAIFSLINLQTLNADNIGKVCLIGIGKLTVLEKLSLAANVIEDIPDEISSLPLTHLNLSGVPWLTGVLEKNIQPSHSFFKATMMKNNAMRLMSEKEMNDLYAKVDKDTNGVLDHNELPEVNKILLEKYPRFGRGRLYYNDSAITPAIWKLTNLKYLSISYHDIALIPDDIKNLQQLESLDVSHNPNLLTLSAQLGGLPLTELHLTGCMSLRTPPKEIVDRGFTVVHGYLRRLQQGSVECKRTKLMVVGLGGAGKTSLIRSMTESGFAAYGDYGEKITDGIDITTWNVSVPKSSSKITYSVWDFAGQTVYYNTHQFFLSNRACYLLLWNIRLGYEHAGLDFWLSSIACHAPKAPILVVGTHCDKVEKSKIPQKELKATYPQIAGFHFVSSYTGEGIQNLSKSLVDVTLEQKYMGERIPEAWLSLEKAVLERREKDDLIPFPDVKTMGQGKGILEESELVQSVQFLHDLGTLQFFNTEFLRSLVVINPQWIVDVMACVVTVHVGPIQEGKLLHKDMAVVWKQYPKELHPWLLRLTEEFDLTFPLADEEANLVPCLLPDTEKEFDWPAIEKDSAVRETKAVYNFKYLPAGLFNRAQVRLHQFAESGQIWKKGMFLKKNNHIAAIQQKGQNILQVKAQGYKPENMLFLVDEVISTLISESYSGVNYDLMVPCIECQNLGMINPSMFPSSKIQRAVELNAPFLQCDNMFHVLSIPELKSLMPPIKTTEFDDHLRRSVMELKNLGEDINISVLFCYSKRNIPDLSEEDKLVHPGHIIEDLRKDGFDVSICDNPETADLESLTIAFKTAQVILFGASDEFCADETCRKLLIFAKETLNKPILLVVLGKSLKFLDSSIGLNITDEVFVKMTDKGRYDTKIIELKEALKKKKSKAGPEDSPKCFISYCWGNSHDAISKGSAKLDGALGYGDPRKFAKMLEEKKIPCWLDIQRVGNAGLFDDIADGLRKAKVVIACVSDEYANSKNCKMEFRFAVAKLKIPTILAVVGTGYNWESSEIGMLAVGSKCPKINFQMNNEAGFLQLYEEVRKHVTIPDKEETTAEGNEDRKKNAFGEILESAERQFLRHLITFKEKSFTADFPRLIVIDLTKKDKQKEEEETKTEEGKESCENRDPAEENKETDQSAESPKGREANFCFTVLCESEEGWHDVDETIPFPQFNDNEEEESYLSMAAPYAARINSILKYTGQKMTVMTTPAGKQLQDKFESYASTVTSEDDVEKAYITLMKDVNSLDENQTYGGLKKTSLLNGKTLWLCEKHREKVGSITEQRYKTQLKPTKLEETPQVKKEKTFTEAPVQPMVATAIVEKQTGVAASSQKPPEPQKINAFKTKNSKSSMRKETSQMCSVM